MEPDTEQRGDVFCARVHTSKEQPWLAPEDARGSQHRGAQGRTVQASRRVDLDEHISSAATIRAHAVAATCGTAGTGAAAARHS